MSINFKQIRKSVFLVFAIIAAGFFISATIAFAAVVPGKPLNVAAVAGNREATVSFSPGTNGGVAITKYTVTASGGAHAEGPASPLKISGLTNGTQYTFTVTATNSAGTTGPASARSAAVTPAAATGATGGSATGTGGTTGTATEAGTTVGVGYPNGSDDNAIVSGSNYDYIQYISHIYGFAMKAAVALSILMVVYAGYKYLTSRGDSGAINEAKDILFSTLMGAALLMLVVLIGNVAGLNTGSWGIL